MKKSIKTSLIIIALALVACVCLVWLVSRPDDPHETFASSASDTSRGPAFEVNVERPRMDRPFGGILPTKVEAKLFGGGELRFDHASRGARIGSVGHDRVELSADGWDLLIETDGEGRVAPGTRLVFPIEIAEKQWTLRCRPADRAAGYLRTTTRAGSGDIDGWLDGRFLVELARCEDAGRGRSSIRKPGLIQATRGRQHRSPSAGASWRPPHGRRQSPSETAQRLASAAGRPQRYQASCR